MALSWLKRLVSPSGLAFVVLCFLFPFFTVSCSGVMGSLQVSYTGMDLAFNGLPSVSGNLAYELSDSDLEDMRPDAQPFLIVSLALVVLGIVLSAALPRHMARTVCAMATAGGALVFTTVQQIVMSGQIRDEMRSEAGEDIQYAAIEVGSGPGYWLVSLLLVSVIVWSVVDLVLTRRGRASGIRYAGGPPGPMPPGYGGPGSAPGVVPPGHGGPDSAPGMVRPGQVPPGHPTRSFPPADQGGPVPGQGPMPPRPPGKPRFEPPPGPYPG